VSIEFTAAGTPRDVSREIEQYATGQGSVTALVVPWESQGAIVNMAVTSVKADGWAIEHTNLGTISLTPLDEGRTRVAIIAAESDRTGEPTLLSVFDRFALQVQRQFELRT
jgi:hypothetical protein